MKSRPNLGNQTMNDSTPSGKTARPEDKERLDQILDAVPEAVITINTRGTITGWNVQAQTLFGWSRQEALGQRLADQIIPAS